MFVVQFDKGYDIFFVCIFKIFKYIFCLTHILIDYTNINNLYS